MNARLLFCSLLLILAGTLSQSAMAQQAEAGDDVLDAFLVTRDAYLINGNNKQRPPAREKNRSAARTISIGLGYTLFKKDADGKPARVNPSQVFREGDGVRFMIESNTSGYVYIFHTENDGPPKMLFPDPRLNEGDNRIRAHVPYEAPSSDEPGGWWFFFDKQAATERFYIVVTRRPLVEVKAGDTLVEHCEENPKNCPWRPSKNFWNGLLAKAGVARISQSHDFGAAQTEAEREAVTRGVELRPGAPAPSVVKMNVSPKAGMLVARVALVHK
jgi:hypothetical protein